MQGFLRQWVHHHNRIHRHRLSVNDYHRMGQAEIFARDARVELINGEIIDMTPIGSEHAGLVKHLNRLFSAAVGERAIVSVQDPITLGQDSEPEPDLALLVPRDDFYVNAHPRAEDVLLIVEVADSSLQLDREIKMPLYARHGIPEVWLINVKDRSITVFQDASQGGYRQYFSPTELSSIEPLKLAGISIDMSMLL